MKREMEEIKKEEWTDGCGKQRSLPEECEFCEKKTCFYCGMNPDRQYP